MALIRWRPFKDIDEFFEDMPLYNFKMHAWDLAADVYQEGDNIIIEMHIPGAEPENINIEVKNHHLYVSGSREETKETKDKQYYHKEIKRGSFERIIELPCAVIGDKAQAEIKGGVLKLILPKMLEKAGSKIKIIKK
jgi:HSP20 family protein